MTEQKLDTIITLLTKMITQKKAPGQEASSANHYSHLVATPSNHNVPEEMGNSKTYFRCKKPWRFSHQCWKQNRVHHEEEKKYFNLERQGRIEQKVDIWIKLT